MTTLELEMTQRNLYNVADNILNTLDPGFVFRADRNVISDRSGYLQAKRLKDLKDRSRKRAPLQIQLRTSVRLQYCLSTSLYTDTFDGDNYRPSHRPREY